MSSSKISYNLNILTVLSTTNAKVFSSILESATKNLLTSINEIFLNISQLTFQIDPKSQQRLAANYETVDSLAELHGVALKRFCVQHRAIVQLGLRVTLDHLKLLSTSKNSTVDPVSA